MLSCPQVDIDGIEGAEERETPRNSIDYDRLAAGEELVDDSSEQE
jgi:hypothetical protein